MKDAKFEVERDYIGVPCSCGGYMDRGDAPEGTPGCKCCIAEFMCRICGDKQIINLPAPEMNF